MTLKKKKLFLFEANAGRLLPKVVKAGWPLGSGGICHCRYANPLCGWGQSVERGHTAACWGNRHRLLPHAFLSIYSDHFLLWPARDALPRELLYQARQGN